jgi:TonB family protein
MNKTHRSLLIVAAVLCFIMTLCFVLAQEGEVKGANDLPSGFVIKLERMGGYLGTYSSFWIYPSGQVINALGETSKIPPDIVEKWLKAIPPPANPPSSGAPEKNGSEFSPVTGAAQKVPSLIGLVCFDCMVYTATIHGESGTRAFMMSASEAEKTFPRMLNQLQHLVWSPLMSPPGEIHSSQRQPIKVGGNIQSSKLIKKVEPIYPEPARKDHIEGSVVLTITVDAEGNVSDVHVLKGHPQLDEAAVTAVSQWKYSPTLLNGEPCPVIATVTLVFSITAAGEPVITVGG